MFKISIIVKIRKLDILHSLWCITFYKISLCKGQYGIYKWNKNGLEKTRLSF